jgi:hypothetical protein
MVKIWSWNRNRNHNFSKVGTGTRTKTFSKVRTGTKTDGNITGRYVEHSRDTRKCMNTTAGTSTKSRAQ